MFKEVPYDTRLLDEILQTQDVNERAKNIINSKEPMIFSNAYSPIPDDYDFTRRWKDERREENPSKTDREVREGYLRNE